MPTAREIMTSPVHTLAPGYTLNEAAALLAEHNIGSMPIVDGEECVGIITDRDIVVSGLARGLDPASTPVGEIATTTLMYVEADDDAAAVAQQMGLKQIRRAPVLENGRVIGMIAQADIARHLGDDTSAGMVQEISQDTSGGGCCGGCGCGN